MIRRILLDLDDTLNSFTMAILGQVFDCPCGPFDYHKFPTEVGYNMIAAYELLHPNGPKYGLVEFWDKIKMEDWANLPKSGEFDYLLSKAERLVGKENVCILTAPTKDPRCLAGKYHWIVNNLPTWLHRQYLIGPRKYFCARGDTLLIDDSDENIKAFRAHGGSAILLPRPWNSLHGLDPYTHVSQSLQRLEILYA